MDTNEVERLLRVVPGLVRREWESKAGVGDLMELSKARLDAEKSWEKAVNVAVGTATAVGLLAIITGLVAIVLGEYRESSRSMNTLMVAVIVGLIIAAIGIQVSGRYTKKAGQAKRELENCNAVFEKFAKSVKSLNPSGIGNNFHDVINNKYISDKACDLAYRVLDAESRFDAARKAINIGRNEVTRAGEWVENCQECFDIFWSAATVDFGQMLDKAEIFKSAASRLEKDDRNRRKLQTAN